jgi:hypothetical protein
MIVVSNKSFTYILIFLFLFYGIASGQQENYTVEKAAFSTSEHAEFSPTFYKNGVVFCSDRGKGIFSYTTSGEVGIMNLYYADTSERSRGKADLLSKDLRTKLNDGPASFNKREDTIYFSRNIFIDGPSEVVSSPRNRLGIFSAIQQEDEWTRVRALRFNSEWFNITSPCLSPDGMRLYFASDMAEGYGDMDIYYCEWRGDYWDEPVNLGPVINTEGNEAYPLISESGDLIFSSDGHPGIGGKDIFLSSFDGTKWQKPVAFKPPVNSIFDDFGLITDPLIEGGYFSSNRDQSIDIFKFGTRFPQVFYANYQKENNYCCSFENNDTIEVDTFRLQYVWNFGDGTTAEGTNVSHCYSEPGEYELNLDVIDRQTGRLF